MGRMIRARFCNSAAHLGATHVEHPTDRGGAALHGTRSRKDTGFPAPAEPCALRLVHPKSRFPRIIGVGGRFAARIGFVHPLCRLCPRGQHGRGVFHGTRAERLFPAAQRRGIGNRLLLRLSLFLDRRGRRVGPRSTTRARIHLIAEAGLSTVAGRPWLPDSRSPFLDRLSRFAQPWWALKPRAPRWGTAGAPNGSADRRNPVMLSAREVLPARVWGSSSRSAYSERLGLLMGTGPGACRCSGRSNRRQTLYRHCVSPPETELLTFAPDRTPSSTGGIIRRRSVGWV